MPFTRAGDGERGREGASNQAVRAVVFFASSLTVGWLCCESIPPLHAHYYPLLTYRQCDCKLS